MIRELTDFAIFLTDPNGCLMSWNPGVKCLLGYSEAEWLGQTAHIIFTPEDRAARQPEEEMAKAARDGRASDVRWHQRKDGTRLFVDGTLLALRDGVGTLLGFSKVMRDITERQQSEAMLQASEQRIQALVTASSEVLYRMSPDWTEMRQLQRFSFQVS
jgi:PAS domain S-box-containing protein